MSKPFDMELFLAGALTGSHATRQRHLRQAIAIQATILERWQRNNPWAWQQKHLVRFFKERLNDRSETTRYYYRPTAELISKRIGKQ